MFRPRSRRKNVFGRLGGRRERTRLGEGDRALDRAHDLALDRSQAAVVEHALIAHTPLELYDRVLRLPRLDFFLIARVRLALALGVGAPAVGLALDQGRPMAGARPFDRATGRLID